MTEFATAVINRSERDRRSAASRKGWANPKARKRASRSAKKAWANASPERREQRIAATTDALGRPEVATKLTEAQRLLSANSEVRAHKSAGRKKAWRTPAGHKARKRASSAMKEKWANASPEERAQWIAAMKEGSSRPGAHERRSKAMKEVSSRPEVRQGRKEAQTKWWANASPEERAQRVAAMHAADSRPEVAERRKASLKTKLAEPAVKAKRSELSKEMWRPNSESRKRMEEGRLKAAAALLASRKGATSKNLGRVDQANDFREKYRLTHGKYPSWTATLRKIDPVGFAAMPREERKTNGKKLGLLVKYWNRKRQGGRKRFLPPGNDVAE